MGLKDAPPKKKPPRLLAAALRLNISPLVMFLLLSPLGIAWFLAIETPIMFLYKTYNSVFALFTTIIFEAVLFFATNPPEKYVEQTYALPIDAANLNPLIYVAFHLRPAWNYTPRVARRLTNAINDRLLLRYSRHTDWPPMGELKQQIQEAATPVLSEAGFADNWELHLVNRVQHTHLPLEPEFAARVKIEEHKRKLQKAADPPTPRTNPRNITVEDD